MTLWLIPDRGLPAHAQSTISNLVTTGKAVWDRALVGWRLHGATSKVESAAEAAPAAGVLDRVKIASIRAMVAQTAPDGVVSRQLDQSLARIESEAAKCRLQARDPGLLPERQEKLRHLAIALDRRVTETRQLKAQLAAEHLKLKAELERLERTTDVGGSQKLKRLDQGNEALRRATERLDRRDP
jgi:hypothetical protein